MQVKRTFARYTGRDLPVFHAVMHSAYICSQYKEGARVYQQLCDSQIGKDAPLYATAVKLFAKLGDPDMVKGIWQDSTSYLLLLA